MSGCGAALACFTCQNLTSCFCHCLGISGDSDKAKHRSKIVYLILLSLSVFWAVLLQYSISPHLNIKGIWDIGCEQEAGDAIYVTSFNNCKGTAAVYRISFMSTLFFLANAVGCFLNRNFHSSCWPQKIFLWLVMMVSAIFIPNTVFSSGYEWFSRLVSFLFLMAQIVILVDFSYRWNDKWVDRSDHLEREEGEGRGKKYLVGLLTISTIFYLISLAGIALMYRYFGNCQLLAVFITITLLGSLFFTYLQLFFDNTGSLFTSSIVTLYCTWLCLSAVSSYEDDPSSPADKKCQLTTNYLDNTTSIIVGGIIAGLSLAWTSFNQFRNYSTTNPESGDHQYVLDTDNVGEDEDRENTRPTLGENTVDQLEQDKGDKESKIAITDEPETEQIIDHTLVNADTDTSTLREEKYYIFHLIMTTGSIYMAMLLTDWGTKDLTENNHNHNHNHNQTAFHNININITGGRTGMWVKIVSEWLTMILYSWTLVASRCFPDRQFS